MYTIFVDEETIFVYVLNDRELVVNRTGTHGTGLSAEIALLALGISKGRTRKVCCKGMQTRTGANE